MSKIEIIFYSVLLTLAILYGVIKYLTKKSYLKGYNAGVKDIGTRIESDAYWFSYDISIFNTLFMMGSHIKKYGFSEVSRLRDEVKRLGDTNVLNEIRNETTEN